MDDAIEGRGGLELNVAVPVPNGESKLARGPDHKFGCRDIGPCSTFVRGGESDWSEDPGNPAQAVDTMLPHKDLFRGSEAARDGRLLHDRDRSQGIYPVQHMAGLADLHYPVPPGQSRLFFRGGMGRVADQCCGLHGSLVLDISPGRRCVNNGRGLGTWRPGGRRL